MEARHDEERRHLADGDGRPLVLAGEPASGVPAGGRPGVGPAARVRGPAALAPPERGDHPAPARSSPGPRPTGTSWPSATGCWRRAAGRPGLARASSWRSTARWSSSAGARPSPARGGRAWSSPASARPAHHRGDRARHVRRGGDGRPAGHRRARRPAGGRRRRDQLELVRPAAPHGGQHGQDRRVLRGRARGPRGHQPDGGRDGGPPGPRLGHVDGGRGRRDAPCTPHIVREFDSRRRPGLLLRPAPRRRERATELANMPRSPLPAGGPGLGEGTTGRSGVARAEGPAGPSPTCRPTTSRSWTASTWSTWCWSSTAAVGRRDPPDERSTSPSTVGRRRHGTAPGPEARTASGRATAGRLRLSAPERGQLGAPDC